MKKKYIKYFFVSLIILLSLQFGYRCNAKEVISIAVASGGYGDNVEDALNGFSWCVDNEIFEFKTSMVIVKIEEQSGDYKFFCISDQSFYPLDPKYEYQVYIIDGVSEESKILFDNELKASLDLYLKQGGGYIGRCAGSMFPPTFDIGRRWPSTLTFYEYLRCHLNSFLGDDAPKVKAYFNAGMALLTQFFALVRVGEFPLARPRAIWAPDAIGVWAYKEWGDPGYVCQDLEDLNKDHPIFKDYWGDDFFVHIQIGGFSNPLAGSDVSVLAKYPAGWDQDTDQQVYQWEYRPNSFTEYCNIIAKGYKVFIGYLLGDWNLGDFKEEFYLKPQWYKLNKYIPTGMSNNPAIIAFKYDDSESESGRIVLSGPHVASQIWDQEGIVENRPGDFSQGQSFKTEGEWDEKFFRWMKKGTQTEKVTFSPNIPLYWYQRREAAWAYGLDFEKLPPTHGRSHVIDITPSFNNNLEIDVSCCVGLPQNESQYWNFENEGSHSLTLYYKYLDVDKWTSWYSYESINKSPYTFSFDANSKNGSGCYRFYCKLTAPNENNVDYSDPCPDYYYNGAYDAEVELGGNIQSKISVEGTESKYLYAKEPIDFNGSKSSTKNGTTITNYTWDFGDGNQSYVTNPTHTFFDDGTYNVSLTVTNNESNSSNSNVTIKTHNNAPTADFSMDYDVVFVDEKVNLTDNSSDIDGNVNVWSWSLGDETNSSIKNTNHSYSKSGIYQISLEITDNDNDKNTITRDILVIDRLVNQSKTPSCYIYNNIQDAINNSLNEEYIYIENGTYTENITIDKSISLIGENRNDIILKGTITIINAYDSELPNNKTIDLSLLSGANMSGNELLMHFNNDTNVGENYSSSNIVYDYSGNNINGIINNVCWNTSTIKGAGAFDFNGNNASINLTYIPSLGNENITISSWVNWKGDIDYIDPILSQCNISNGFCLFINNTDGKPVFQLDNNKVISSISISNNSWHYITGSYDNKTLKIYVDGVLRGNTNKSGFGIISNCYIGYDNNSNYFNGTIDEIAIWNRSLSDKEIELIYYGNTGLKIKEITFQDTEVGLNVCDYLEISRCNFINNTIGLLINNTKGAQINICNITESDSGIIINNSNSEEYYPTFVYNCIVENVNSGILVKNSSQINIFNTFVNGSNNNLSFYNCDIDNITVGFCSSPNNAAPEELNVTAPSMGKINTTYNFSAYTFDKNDDQMLYRFDWGDGNDTGWLWLYENNETVNASYSWLKDGNFNVTVTVKDVFNAEINKTSVFIIDVLSPIVNSVDSNPNPVGYGCNISITANVSDNKTGGNSGVKTVKVNITSPNNICLGNFTMNLSGNDTYAFVFNNTWERGRYNYSIWACDNANYTIFSEGYYFNVSAYANITVCTVKDEYTDNETVNLTDPPGSSYKVGYELLDNNKVLHIWNPYDSYYFNTSNGVQFTNHKDEYWSTNVLMLGYYNNNSWNLIYRTDNLSGFNKNIISDNETYVNTTLWKDLTYQGYDFRLAVRYYLGVDDNELTVIPYIKNLDDENITYNLGFAWEIKDIQVDMTTTGDYIEINRTTYFLNQTLDETYTNLTDSCYYIKENKTSNTFESLYLRWDNSLNYKIKVESRDGQYNAPIKLGIKIGTLDVGQEKYTSLFWHDASEITYYYDDYSKGETWTNNPSYMTDGSTTNYASTTQPADVELCNNNTCSGTNLGTISKVEIRAYGYYTLNQRDIYLRPVFNGTTDGNNNTFVTLSSPSWSRWFDITDDVLRDSYPSVWTWNEIRDMDCDVELENDFCAGTNYCSKIEIRVTYNNLPGISNPYPEDDATGISITPTLNITVSDPDGDLMNISWLSNSSGSWQEFGTNSSVSNGTYHQTFSNASLNGQWWYWKVNVSDDDGYNVTSIFKFYTGNQSKIVNSGNTDIKGYLLIQVHYYNSTLDSWLLANDTINETSLSTIEYANEGLYNNHILGLDTIFNGLVNTSNLIDSFGYGNYRVYAAFRNPDGDVLVCDDESLLETTYNFTINID